MKLYIAYFHWGSQHRTNMLRNLLLDWQQHTTQRLHLLEAADVWVTHGAPPALNQQMRLWGATRRLIR